MLKLAKSLREGALTSDHAELPDAADGAGAPPLIFELGRDQAMGDFTAPLTSGIVERCRRYYGLARTASSSTQPTRTSHRMFTSSEMRIQQSSGSAPFAFRVAAGSSPLRSGEFNGWSSNIERRC